MESSRTKSSECGLYGRKKKVMKISVYRNFLIPQGQRGPSGHAVIDFTSRNRKPGLQLGFVAETNDPSRSLMGGHFRLFVLTLEHILMALCKNAFFDSKQTGFDWELWIGFSSTLKTI
ncbi:hypothetical protein CEXT_443061 [Caerostris extrusa]|uniref:Uncharacterized protein n=1 Tax=Caerostris extrusa TaxID=172846 RepID=A0AAV4NQ17_CAEEX|nr:hypothetical protein CEXT_443061 [Caerostris extrusa]